MNQEENVLLKGIASGGPMDGKELTGPPRGLTVSQNHRTIGYYDFFATTGGWVWKSGPQAARDERPADLVSELKDRAAEKRRRKAARRKA